MQERALREMAPSTSHSSGSPRFCAAEQMTELRVHLDKHGYSKCEHGMSTFTGLHPVQDPAGHSGCCGQSQLADQYGEAAPASAAIPRSSTTVTHGLTAKKKWD